MIDSFYKWVIARLHEIGIRADVSTILWNQDVEELYGQYGDTIDRFCQAWLNRDKPQGSAINYDGLDKSTKTCKAVRYVLYMEECRALLNSLNENF